METNRERRPLLAARPLEFFLGFLRNPKEVGSVIPSSRFLIRRILECGSVADRRVIVELGPGTGVLTRELLHAMPRNGRLVAVEINTDFVGLLAREFDDPRLTVCEGHSTDLVACLAQAGEESADLVVSGIPFSTMTQGEGRRTLEAAREILAPGGRFVAYQFRSHVRRMAEPLFGPAVEKSEILNIPPMKVYTWTRDGR